MPSTQEGIQSNDSADYHYDHDAAAAAGSGPAASAGTTEAAGAVVPHTDGCSEVVSHPCSLPEDVHGIGRFRRSWTSHNRTFHTHYQRRYTVDLLWRPLLREPLLTTRPMNDDRV